MKIQIHSNIESEVRSEFIKSKHRLCFRVGLIGEKEGILQKIEWMVGCHSGNGGCAWTPYIDNREVVRAFHLLADNGYNIAGFIKAIADSVSNVAIPYLYWKRSIIHGDATRSYPTLLFISFVPNRGQDGFFVTRDEQNMLHVVVND